MNKLSNSPINLQKGLTMIEILVALLILAVGLLGVASLQVRSVQDTSNSNLRSVAIYMANDMADRIRSNQVARSAGNYNSVAGASETASCLQAAGCTAIQMANHDKWEWLENLGNALPQGAGTITVNGDIYTIEVTWNDRVTQVDNADPDNKVKLAQSSVSMSFQP